MNKEFITKMRDEPVWNRDFKDWDDVLDNGILKSKYVLDEGKTIQSILRTSDLLETHWEKLLSRFDLSIPQAHILHMLYFKHSKHITQDGISRMMFKSKANISTILARMEEKNLIERKDNLENKREKLVFITKEGTQKIEKVLASYVEEHRREPLFTKDEMEVIVSTLSKVRTKLKEDLKNEN